MIDVGLKLAFYRKKLRFSQKEIAEKANISQTYLSQIEHGERMPSIEVLLNLCQVLGLELKLSKVKRSYKKRI